MLCLGFYLSGKGSGANPRAEPPSLPGSAGVPKMQDGWFAGSRKALGLMSQEVTAPQTPQIRRPRQKRSQERFERILDVAEELLEELEPGNISIYTLAEKADMSPPSIYHFFPDSQHVFGALAERYFQKFSHDLDPVPVDLRQSWQDLIEFRFAATRRFYNEHIAARKVILGSGSSWSIRTRDFELVEELARAGVAEIAHNFILPFTPGIVDRMMETIALNDGLWTNFNHRFGHLPDDMEVYARRARIAHMRTYLPEYLEVRMDPRGHSEPADPPG